MIKLLKEYNKYCEANAEKKKLYKFFLAYILFMKYKNPFSLVQLDDDEGYMHQILFNSIQLLTFSRFIKLMFGHKNNTLVYNSAYEGKKPNVCYKFSIESIRIEGVKRIIPDCFWNFMNLKEVVICKDVEIIERGAFKDCISLEKVMIPNTLSKIEANAFMNCINLKQVVFY